MRFRITSISILALLSVEAAIAQQPQRSDIDIQDFVEDLFQIPDEDVNYNDLYETLYQLYSNPINLNNTSKNELNSLYQLNVEQINRLMEYLSANSPMISIYELQVVEGFDIQTIKNILPFVEVQSPRNNSTKGNLLQRMAKEENNYFMLRMEMILENQEGYLRKDSSRYLGSPHKIYGRFRSSHAKDFSVGLTFEKDAGEQFLFDIKQKIHGFDYYSFHLFLEKKGSFKRIAIGDYQMQFGQGLVIGSGFNPGKGAETITTVKRSNSGFRPYTSALETSFMRGIGLTYSHKGFDISPFYSRLNQDGVIRSGDQSGEHEEYISSIQDIGMHRTYAELDSRKGILEESFGLNVTFNELKNKNFQTGFTFIQNKFSVPIQKTPNNYNQFEFQGDANNNIGLFANYNWYNFLLFSEIARSKSGGTALVAGFMGSLSPILSLSFHYRNYSKNYHSFYGNSFGEGSRNINESGLYWGMKITPNRKTTISAYYDYFKFPWLKFGVDSPSKGYEHLIRAEYKPTRKIKFYAQFREQSKEESVSLEGSNLKRLEAGIKRNYAANLDFSVNNTLSLKSRIQFSSFDLGDSHSTGMTLIQDLNIKINNVTMSARFALFDCDDYDNRQYVYEKDLLYVFSIPAYAGQGTRTYLMLQYKPFRKLTIWGRYGRFNYRNVNSIGSGLNKINGNTRSDLKFQIRYKI